MGYRTSPCDMPGGDERDTADHGRLRHARDAATGFAIGRYLQPPPMLFSRDGHNVFLGDLYRGSSVFLVCSGPSLKTQDLSLLNRRGVLTCAVNNAATIVRPNLWVSVDDPGNFADAIWRDPAITKMVPLCHMEKPFTIRNNEGKLCLSKELVGDMPNVFGFRRNESFNPEQFLYEDTINWGNHGKVTDSLGVKGSRSVMLAAMRLLFYLGVRTVYLLGCDFKMVEGQANYAFAQDRSKSSVQGNNSTFLALNERFKSLLPHFDREGFQVLNCTPNSGLKAFPSLDFEQAVSKSTSSIPASINTVGMYDRLAKQPKPPKTPSKTVRPDRDRRDLIKGVPAMTLVTWVNSRSVEYFDHAFRSWMNYTPWLRRLEKVVFVGPGVDRRQLPSLKETTRLRVIDITSRDCNAESRDSLCRYAIQWASKNIRTSYWLKIEPEAAAHASTTWLDPSLFTQSAGERPQSLIAPPWGYARPANTFERFNEWAKTSELFEGTPPLTIAFDPAADRVKHPVVSTWLSVFARDWTKDLSKYIASCPEEFPVDPLIFYCAQRMGRKLSRINFKELGWKHSFGKSPLEEKVGMPQPEVAAGQLR